MMGTSHEDLGTLMTAFRSILRIRNVSGKRCTHKHNISFMFNNFSSGSRGFHEVMWSHTAEKARNVLKYNSAHALCMLDNKSYRHKLRTCNTYWYPL
jgi:hypothetical protein